MSTEVHSHSGRSMITAKDIHNHSYSGWIGSVFAYVYFVKVIRATSLSNQLLVRAALVTPGQYERHSPNGQCGLGSRPVPVHVQPGRH